MAGGNESFVCLSELKEPGQKNLVKRIWSKESGCTTFAIIRSLRYNTIYTRREI